GSHRLLLELDSNKLPERMAEARRSILDRAEEVLTRPPDEERHALNNGAQYRTRPLQGARLEPAAAKPFLMAKGSELDTSRDPYFTISGIFAQIPPSNNGTVEGCA